MLDIARDARWGRIVEGAGEDPYLGAAMAAAQVRGFQGDDHADPERVLACAKHFAGYGASEGGRDYDPVYLSESQLRNTYLPPFAAAVKAGAATFMGAYMDLNDVPASGNRFLLRQVLREEWGFDGLRGVGRVRRRQHGHSGSCPRRARCCTARHQSRDEHGHVQLHLHQSCGGAGGRGRADRGRDRGACAPDPGAQGQDGAVRAPVCG
jgi:hypothetical protein